MIKSINIKKFASFSDFDWPSCHECKRLNILYGRNYSGKTVLSRVLRSFEVRKLPENFGSPEFSLNTNDKRFAETDIHNHSLDIRVYNKDFVDENLSFLKDHREGKISTFAILGSENKEIKQKIKEKEAALGSREARSGLRHELDEQENDFSEKKEKADNAKNELNDKLRDYANKEIKKNSIFSNPNYNIRAIEQDIEDIKKNNFSILVKDEVQERRDILTEKALPDINKDVSYLPAFTTLLTNAKNILKKKIRPSVPIQDLLNDAALQTWVRAGMDHHRDRRKDCGFCGQRLPPDLWKKLDEHFSKESSDLDEELTGQISAVENEINTGSNISLPTKESFYVSKRKSFETQHNSFLVELKSYQAELNKILKQLRARKEDIFKTRELPDISDFSEALHDKVKALNELIKENNSVTVNLPRLQEAARDELRLNAVANFMRDINFDNEKQRVEELEKEKNLSKDKRNELNNNVGRIENEIKGLRTKIQDEKKGAEKVNEYLNHYFGHESVRLEAIEDPEDPIESKFKFQIMRGDDLAYNMSEGECSLVAFCYFMARLEDIKTKGKDLIIYIDDPISSLDSNNIFFIFSLIESVLTSPEKNNNVSSLFKYKQLFISTHNLDFFKYLVRIKRQKNEMQFFLIDKIKNKSTIKSLPKYLKNYQTEFNYLFEQIYRCKDIQSQYENYEICYNFGNNLRCFLEAYLFYRYPFIEEHVSSSERANKFFGEDSLVTTYIKQINNEFSHLGESARSMRPIDVPDISSVANLVLKKMHEKDKDQFDALLKSIDAPEWSNENL